MKPMYIFLLSLLVATALLILDQIWFQWLAFDVFVKTLVTLGIVMGVLFVIFLARRDYQQEKTLQRDHFVD